MTVVAEPAPINYTEEDAPPEEPPTQAWARRHGAKLAAAGAAALAAAVILVAVKSTAPAAPPTPNTVKVTVDGDVASTTGTARFSSGLDTTLPTGITGYTSTSPDGETVVAIAVSVAAGDGQARCRITVNGTAVADETISDHAVALCFWAGNSEAPPPFTSE